MGKGTVCVWGLSWDCLRQGPRRAGAGVIVHKVGQQPALFCFWRMRQMTQKHIPRERQLCPVSWHGAERVYKGKLTSCRAGGQYSVLVERTSACQPPAILGTGWTFSYLSAGWTFSYPDAWWTFSYLRWTFSYLCQEIRWPVGTGGQTCFTYKNGQTGPSVRWLQTCKLHLHLPSHTGCCHLSSGTGTFLRSHTLRESRDVRAGRVAESSAWLPQAWLCTFWMARDGAQGGRQPGGVGGCAQDPWVQFALFPSPDSQKWMAPRLSPL